MKSYMYMSLMYNVFICKFVASLENYLQVKAQDISAGFALNPVTSVRNGPH